MRRNKQKKIIVGVVLVTLIMLFSLSVNGMIEVKKIDTVWINPAEDGQSSVNINFHSSSDTAVLYYTKSEDTAFENALSLELSGSVPASDKYYEQRDTGLYTYKVTLSDLEADCDYIFRIVCDGQESDVYTFKTAGCDMNFSFGWIGDVHADPAEKPKIILFDKLIDIICEKSANQKLGFVAFSGDIVKYGNHYQSWQEYDRSKAVSSYIMATTPGNKEYYRVNSYKDGSKTKYYSLEWYDDTINNPQNGPVGVEGTYYFLYDHVLFMSINSCMESSSNNKVKVDSTAVKVAQRKWFEDVVKKNEGKYEYIVVENHYAYFLHDRDTNSEIPCNWGFYDDWRDLYDKYGVDIALSGDCHEYCRSNRIYNNAPSDDDNKGTVYLTYSELSTYNDGFNMQKSESPLVDVYNVGCSRGAGLFDVSKEGIKYSFYAYNGSLVDSVFIPAKNRGWTVDEPVQSDENAQPEEGAKQKSTIPLIVGSAVLAAAGVIFGFIVRKKKVKSADAKKDD